MEHITLVISDDADFARLSTADDFTTFMILQCPEPPFLSDLRLHKSISVQAYRTNSFNSYNLSPSLFRSRAHPITTGIGFRLEAGMRSRQISIVFDFILITARAVCIRSAFALDPLIWVFCIVRIRACVDLAQQKDFISDLLLKACS